MHFRLVSHLVHAGVQEHHAQHGSVCPGQFVYHYFDVPTYDEGNDVTWSFELHSGDVYYLTRHAHAPLKLTQPYDHADSEDHVLHRTHTEVQNCHVLDGRYYLALRGGEHCAEYDVAVEVTLGMGAAATSGSFTGGSFHAYDFQSHPEDLIVVLGRCLGDGASDRGHCGCEHSSDDLGGGSRWRCVCVCSRGPRQYRDHITDDRVEQLD